MSKKPLKPRDRGMQPLNQVLFDYVLEDKGGYITKEFQDFGYRMAQELGDEKHKALYMKLAKEEKRPHLEQALNFVLEAPNVKSKARLFMWALSKLKKGEKIYAQKNFSASSKDNQRNIR